MALQAQQFFEENGGLLALALFKEGNGPQRVTTFITAVQAEMAAASVPAAEQDTVGRSGVYARAYFSIWQTFNATPDVDQKDQLSFTIRQKQVDAWWALYQEHHSAYQAALHEASSGTDTSTNLMASSGQKGSVVY